MFQELPYAIFFLKLGAHRTLAVRDMREMEYIPAKQTTAPRKKKPKKSSSR